jgi:hypothetical protein
MNEDGVGWGEYLWVKDSKTEKKKRKKKKRELIWVAFQYKKIPKFCFKCEVIRHGTTGCGKAGSQRLQGNKLDNQFGPWLWATSLTKRYEAGSERYTGKKRESSHE